MGNSHPSLFPYEPLPCADGELIVTAGNDGQFRRLCEVLGLPELPDDPRFARNEDRTANRDELRPLLVERLRTRPKMDWFRDIIGAGVPCGPINTIDQGVAFAEEIGLDPVVTVGEGAAAVPSVRNPITFSATGAEYRLPPPTLDEHGDGDPALARRGPGGALRMSTAGQSRPTAPADGAPLSFPTSLGTSTADEIRLLGQDLTADLMGKVGFGELAFWLVSMRRPTPSETRVFEAVLVALADHGFTPTAIAARLTYLSAPDSLQGALAAGLLGGGSRFLGVTEDCGTYLHAVLGRRRTGRCPTDDAGWDALALEAVQATRAAGRFVPGLGHPVHKVRRPPDAGAHRHRGGGGAARAAPAAVRGDRPGARAGARPPAAAQRRRRLRSGPGRPRAAGRDAARLRPARPGRRAARPARRGAPPSDRHGRLPRRRPQRRLRRPRRTEGTDARRRPHRAGAGARLGGAPRSQRRPPGTRSWP